MSQATPKRKTRNAARGAAASHHPDRNLREARAGRRGRRRPQPAALAASYKTLIEGLIELDEHLESAGLGTGFPSIPDILARAMAVFREEEAVSSQSWQKRREADEAEYAEAVRRHELAMTVECPYCGAQPGTACRTAGPSGEGHLKGIHDHKNRYRAATDPEWKRAAG